MSVDAVAKLAQYTIGLLADPLLATWRARREVKADRIRAEGQAEFLEILAVGEARAELAGRAVRELAEGSQVVAALIENEIDRRVESVFQKRVDNLAQIVARAERALPSGQVPDVEPDMPWTSSFSNAAQDISDNDMQELWARVLAGEVGAPGSTSIRTLNVLHNLDQSTARLFRRLCSMAMSISLPDLGMVRHQVASIGGNANSGTLGIFGLPYTDLCVLNEYELIRPDFNSWSDYQPCIAIEGSESPRWFVRVAFTYQGEKWGLVPNVDRDPDEEFRVRGVYTSKAGRELSSVVELEEVPEYDEALMGYFVANGFDMVQVESSG